MANKIYEIDIVRAIFEKYLDNENVKIASFYEPINNGVDVNRYTSLYTDIINEANREDLKGAGILSIEGNPQITNLHRNYICPFEWSLNISTKLKYRDEVTELVNDLIEKLKGTKVDVALLDDEIPFVVGTIGKSIYFTIQTRAIEQNSYIGDFNGVTVDSSSIKKRKDKIIADSILTPNTKQYTLLNDDIVGGSLFYLGNNGKLECWKCVDEDNNIFAKVEGSVPNHTSFKKLKCSFGFNVKSTDEPYTMNGEDKIYIKLSGMATIVDERVMLGNDLVSVNLLKENDNILDANTLEPIGFPSNISLDGINYQIRNNIFKTNSHKVSIGVVIQYEFILDMEKPILKQLFQFTRYGLIDKNNSTTPNTRYYVFEIISSWGNVMCNCLVGNIKECSIENSESDVMSISVPIELQGSEQ